MSDGQTMAQDPTLRHHARGGNLLNHLSTLVRNVNRPDDGTPMAKGPSETGRGVSFDMYDLPYIDLAENLFGSEEVIPKIIPSYTKVLYKTNHFTKPPATPNLTCTCTSQPKQLSITVVRWDTLDHLNLRICKCWSAAEQLVQLGLFPCAPLHPSLAVEMKLLEFVTGLFVRVAPNQTAFCGALEEFLANRGYHLAGEDPLRRRFSNALEWYNAMQDMVNVQLDEQVTSQRPGHAEQKSSTEHLDDVSEAPTGSENNGEHVKRPRDGNTEPLTRPSDYLRSRCPLCFGGKFPVQDGLDACFTQKHNKQERDPERFFPKSVFVPEEKLEAAEEYVERLRPSHPKRSGQKNSAETNSDEGLRVPGAVLDDCQASFTAADERREKGSTKYFDCTALMGLLCRHDRVLWLANMKSVGEKQFYVIVLDLLFEHLPLDFIVGVLYDIGCTLHRSCMRHGFLEKYIDRIAFGVSVFHAFGHEWACQLVYHPRKAVGFGLSDGEGAEWFWHSISKLIPYLRVAGYHWRLYTLD
ncbi:hypothetical protein PM082_009654 [Marasmius tenuissimus]|nr:hypothetical protein PM082_009654 [Marasmius tenuissimus]